VLADALALQAAGAFAVVLEMVPADAAKRITGELMIPTIGIGAGRTATRRCWSGRTWPGCAAAAAAVREEVRRPARHLAGRGGHLRPRGPHRRLPGPEHSYS
jgi:3-methyl-2-oxobutanoate hydroxymethyltransferase